jgi:alpha-tubulin suppressor-like RCC1 family protein
MKNLIWFSIVAYSAAFWISPSLALSNNSKVIAWGQQLGSQDVVPSNLTNAIAIAVGNGGQKLALRQDGSVLAWGNNAYGQTNVPSGLRAAAVAAGHFHNLALKADGTVVAWGYYQAAATYYGSPWLVYPVYVPTNLMDVIAIAAGRGKDLALTRDGTVKVWGPAYEATQPPSNLSNVVAIAVGTAQNLALKRDGTVTAWGSGFAFGSPMPDYQVPTGLSNVVAVSANHYNFAAIREDGLLSVWGDNQWGQLTIPSDFRSNITAVAVGDQWYLALRNDGALTAWGMDAWRVSFVPKVDESIQAIAAGDQHCLALLKAGPPELAQEPADQKPFAGRNASFTVKAFGSSPLQYQWMFNGAPIRRATNSVLTLNAVQATNVGTYYAVVSNSYAAVTSRLAVLTLADEDVNVLPATNIESTKATLNVSVNPRGEPTTVVFEYGSTTNFGRFTLPVTLSGSTNFMLASAEADDLAPGLNYYFRASATDAYGSRVSDTLSFDTLPLFSVIDPGLAGAAYGGAAWGDYDNDGDLDLIVTGTNLVNATFTHIYQNNGNERFSTNLTSIPGIWHGSVAWGDFDNDELLDVLIVGTSSYGPISEIHRNNGDGTFTLAARLSSVSSGWGRWADFNSDGLQDVLIAQSSPQGYAVVYTNADAGAFVPVEPTLPGYLDSQAALADYDKDGAVDILLTGHLGDYSPRTTLHRNLGNGRFESSGISFQGVFGAADWGDYDRDGYPDLIVMGRRTSGLAYAFVGLYGNNRDGTFSLRSTNLPSLYPNTVQWADYDNDGWLDSFLGGQSYYNLTIIPSNSLSGVLRNNGDNTFVHTFLPLPEIWGISGGCGGWGDYNGDGRLDAVLSGNSRSGAILRLYKNNWPIRNTRPASPQQLSAVVNNDVRLSWIAGSDAQTPASSLSYNVRVGRTPGGSDVLSAMSRPDGWRRVPGLGNAGYNNRFTLKGLAPGKYFWSVQSIDGAFAGSVFASEQTFTVGMRPLIALGFADDTMPGVPHIHFSGNPDLGYLIQGSTNLVDWMDLGLPAQTASNRFEFVDRMATNVPARFYRVVSP